MTIVLDGNPVDTKYELLTDGREVVATHQGRRIASRLRWEGDALIATWRIESANDAMTIAFRYELQNEGRRIQATEQIRNHPPARRLCAWVEPRGGTLAVLTSRLVEWIFVDAHSVASVGIDPSLAPERVAAFRDHVGQ
jgi:hypothetical protein